MHPAAFAVIFGGAVSSVLLYLSHRSFKYGGRVGAWLCVKVLKTLGPIQGPIMGESQRSIEVCLVRFDSGEEGLGIIVRSRQIFAQTFDGLAFRREAAMEWVAGLRAILEESEAGELWSTRAELPESRELKSAWTSLDDVVSGQSGEGFSKYSQFGERVDRLLHGVMGKRGIGLIQCLRIFQLNSWRPVSKRFGVDFGVDIFSSEGTGAIILTEEQLREHLRQIESLGFDSY